MPYKFPFVDYPVSSFDEITYKLLFSSRKCTEFIALSYPFILCDRCAIAAETIIII
jgi:hypothetical protein